MIKSRLCPPTKLDIEDFGTIYKVTTPKETVEYYIQLGTDTEISWHSVGFLLSEIFKQLYEEKEFIDELLMLYQDCDRSVLKLCEIITTHF